MNGLKNCFTIDSFPFRSVVSRALGFVIRSTPVTGTAPVLVKLSAGSPGTGTSVAVAIAALGESSSGADWARHGLCWSAVSADEVEGEAMRLAANPARNPALARAVMSTMRSEFGPPRMPWPVALELERAEQLRSFDRAARARNPFENGRRVLDPFDAVSQ